MERLMRKFVSAAIVAAALSLPMATGAVAGSSNPIFGASSTVQKLDDKAMKSVVGQNTTSAYYAYLGNLYGTYATQYGSYGAYLEAFGSGQQSARNTYYYYAYAYSSTATTYYLYAYYYN
jgi:hypothetical protein